MPQPKKSPGKKPCPWALSSEAMLAYHDREWGRPVHDDGKQFEFLVLEGAQAGLSWSTILNRRAGYRKAFAGFDARKVARFDARKIASLLRDPGIIRNRAKVRSAVANARAFLAVQKEFGSFDRFIWGCVGGKPLRNRWKSQSQIPARTPVSDALSKELKKRGFSFVGSTICYAHMQAVGMVDDHLVSCPRHSGTRKKT